LTWPVTPLAALTDHRSPAEVYGNLDGSFKLVDVHLLEALVPRRVDTQVDTQAVSGRWPRRGSAG
jgi:hypothetical protein